MGSHSVTCHPAEVTFPPLFQPKPVLDLATPEGCKAELTGLDVCVCVVQTEVSVCHGDGAFLASCHNDSAVLVINAAEVIASKRNRCRSDQQVADVNVCSNDVRSFVERQCGGRRRCVLRNTSSMAKWPTKQPCRALSLGLHAIFLHVVYICREGQASRNVFVSGGGGVQICTNLIQITTL